MNTLTWRRLLNTINMAPTIRKRNERADGFGDPSFNATELRAGATIISNLTDWFRANPTQHGRPFAPFDNYNVNLNYMWARGASRDLKITLDRDAVRNMSANDCVELFAVLGILQLEQMFSSDKKMLYRIMDKYVSILDAYADGCSRTDDDYNAMLWERLIRKKFAKQIKESGWTPMKKKENTNV